MSRVLHKRPAARSAAVRPHSAFLPSPRPVSAASRCSTSLFFAPLPRPLGQQSCWVAGPCSHGDWEHGRGWERLREQENRACSGAYATVPTVPTVAPAHVMRLRARVHVSLSLCLGTWEHLWIVLHYQSLTLFPRLFPAPGAVGTWEQPKASAPRSARLPARSNKIRGGYADLQLSGGDARDKFRGSIARLAGVDQGALGRIQLQPTRRGGNGGNRPLSERLAGHVGRVMLEVSRQPAEIGALLGSRLKLGRLRDRRPGRAPAGELEQLPLGPIAAVSAEATPGAPNPIASSAAMLALHAGRIWIEAQKRALRAVLCHDGSSATAGLNAQTDTRRRGPGGIRFSNAAGRAERTYNREVGKRAGVNSHRRFARPHDAGEFAKLRRDFFGVNGAAA